ncbi:MAG TPA: VOC family protein [Thermomicrobiales bacterium]|nr:VOC family protein [Thermomicrobiales bacterium]
MSTSATFGFVVEYVADIEATRRYLVETLGLTVAREAPTFVQFTDSNGASFAIASDESMTGARDPELYWLVDDAEATHRDLATRTDITLPLTQKPFGTVFGVTDPAGQPHYLLELARNRPSRAV